MTWDTHNMNFSTPIFEHSRLEYVHNIDFKIVHKLGKLKEHFSQAAQIYSVTCEPNVAPSTVTGLYSLKASTQYTTQRSYGPTSHDQLRKWTSASTFQNQISWNKLWKFLEFHKISRNFTKGSSLLYQLYMMLLIPKRFLNSRNYPWKPPKFLNFGRSGNAEVDTMKLEHCTPHEQPAVPRVWRIHNLLSAIANAWTKLGPWPFIIKDLTHKIVTSGPKSQSCNWTICVRGDVVLVSQFFLVAESCDHESSNMWRLLCLLNY